MGSFASVCCMTGCPITKGDRAAVLLVEMQPKHRYRDTDPDALYQPRGVFGRGVYDEYGWIIPDENQPEFELLLNVLLGTGIEAESWQIHDAVRNLEGSTYKRLASETQRGTIKILMVQEAALDRAIEQCLDPDAIERQRGIYKQAEADWESLMAQGETASQLSRNARYQQREAYETLCETLLSGIEFSTLAIADLFLEQTPHPECLPFAEDALLESNWCNKVGEVGAFFLYHKRYLWRPVCHPGFAITPYNLHFGGYIPFVQERRWLAQQAMAVFQREQNNEDREDTYIPCNVIVDDGKVSFTANAFGWLVSCPPGVQEPQSIVGDRLRQIFQDPTNREFVREFLLSEYAIQDEDWLFAREYVRRFDGKVTGEFDFNRLKAYLYFYQPTLAKSLGITLD